MAGLNPELAALAIRHRTACERAGIPLVFLSGRRTWQEQMDLYAKGRARTAEGWIVVDAHEVVTMALPDRDPHCIGAAYDCAPAPGHRVDWNRLDLFQRVAQLAPAGLVWGGTWPKLRDLSHYEMVGWRTLLQPAA